MKRILIPLIALWTLTAQAQDGDVLRTRNLIDNVAVHRVATADGIGLFTLELLGQGGAPMAGAEPILLVHGFTQNTNAWHAEAEALRAKGYRVFVANWRGHGQGPLRSVGLDGRAPDGDSRMVFDNLPAYDVPALVDFVYETAGRRRFAWVGHSMGGMMMHLALAGVSRGANGEMELSAERRAALENKLKSFIAIGSPVRFSVKAEGLSGFKESALETLISITGMNLDRSSLSSLRSLPFAEMALQAHLSTRYEMGRLSGLMSGLMDLRNVSRAEYGHEKLYMGSNVPRPFLESLSFTRTGYRSADGRLDYAELSMGRADRPSVPRVPTLLVSADNDMLAPLAEQTQTARQRGFEQIVVKDTGHIDLIVGRRALEMVAHIAGFATSGGAGRCGRVLF